jgi:hypothetical protein
MGGEAERIRGSRTWVSRMTGKVIKGDVFVQNRSGRRVVVVDPEYEDGMISFYYEDGGEKDWFYCTVEEVVVFDGYTKVEK